MDPIALHRHRRHEAHRAVIAFALAGLGNGLQDSAWNAWMGAMTNANEVLGFLHGFYGVGGTIAPTIATTLISALCALPDSCSTVGTARRVSFLRIRNGEFMGTLADGVYHTQSAAPARLHFLYTTSRRT